MNKPSKNPENLGLEWLDLKNEKLLIEKRMEELKPLLEEFLQNQGDRQFEMHGFNFKLINTEREFFKLSEAKKKIDGRILRPYITVSNSNSIRTTSVGQKKEAA